VTFPQLVRIMVDADLTELETQLNGGVAALHRLGAQV
jgi:hypothetical protein